MSMHDWNSVKFPQDVIHEHMEDGKAVGICPHCGAKVVNHGRQNGICLSCHGSIEWTLWSAMVMAGTP